MSLTNASWHSHPTACGSSDFAQSNFLGYFLCGHMQVLGQQSRPYLCAWDQTDATMPLPEIPVVKALHLARSKGNFVFCFMRTGPFFLHTLCLCSAICRFYASRLQCPSLPHALESLWCRHPCLACPSAPSAAPKAEWANGKFG